MLDHAFANAERALGQLVSFLALPERDDRDRAGIIQAFEFTYEAFWKLFQKLAAAEGTSVGTPKKALGAALKMGLIADEEVWLAMLNARNLTSHVYQQALALAVVEEIRDRFVKAFSAALAAARENP